MKQVIIRYNKLIKAVRACAEENKLLIWNSNNELNKFLQLAFIIQEWSIIKTYKTEKEVYTALAWLILCILIQDSEILS